MTMEGGDFRFVDEVGKWRSQGEKARECGWVVGRLTTVSEVGGSPLNQTRSQNASTSEILMDTIKCNSVSPAGCPTNKT